MRLLLSSMLLGASLLAVPDRAQKRIRLARESVISVPGDVPTIQEAIDVVPEHGTVAVDPGVYFESITFRGKAITVRSTAGAEVTTIDGSLAMLPVVRFYDHEGPDSRLSGFTITGGLAGSNGGAGISCWNDDWTDAGGSATPTITDCIITRNVRYEYQTFGMGVAGDATLERCKILRNGAIASGGDGFISGGGVSGTPTLRECEIRSNVANSGGGLELWDGAVVEDSIIANNLGGPCQARHGPCLGFGGGIRAHASTAPGARGIQIVRCIVKENRVEGIAVDGSAFQEARVARLFVRDGALDPGVATPPGELLIDPAAGLRLFRAATFAGGAATFAFTLPRDRSLIGLRLHAQAWIVAADGLHLSNALELFLGEEARPGLPR